MGILDEAIREHLELKRQHGADDSELQQIEDEAFGPPARPGDAEAATSGPPVVEVAESEAPTEFMPAAGSEDAPAQVAGGELAPTVDPSPTPEAGAPPEPETTAPDVAEPPPEAEAGEPPLEQPTELYDVEGEIAASGAAPPIEEPVEAEISESDDLFDEQSLSDELDQALESTEAEAEPEEDLEPAEEELEPPPEPGPAEAPPEEAPDDSGFDDQEDVLEETPEFLQDTPESDRLWFEQKPPKDFDFDD